MECIMRGIPALLLLETKLSSLCTEWDVSQRTGVGRLQ